MPQHFVDPRTPAGNTRSQGNDGWGKQHVHMDDAYHRATRKYNAYKRKTRKAAKAAQGVGGRRRRGRYTRRR